MTAHDLYRQFYKARTGNDWTFGDTHDWALTVAEARFVSKGITLTDAQAKQTPTAKGIHQATQLANYGYQNLYKKSNTTLYSEQAPTFPVMMLALLLDTAGYLSQDEATLLELDQLFDERDWDKCMAAVKALRGNTAPVDNTQARREGAAAMKAAILAAATNVGVN